MLTQQAVVTLLDGSYAWVKPLQSSGCRSCAGRGCYAALASQLFSKQTTGFRVLNPVNARLRDRVTVALDERVLIKGAYMAFVMPILMLLAGAVLGLLMAANTTYAEMASLLSGIAGLALWYVFLPVIYKSVLQDNSCLPVILDRCVSSNPVGHGTQQ